MKPTLAPLAARILAAIAGTACPFVQAADSPLALPSDTITSAVVETQEGIAEGYQGKPTTGTTRLNLTNQQTPQGVTAVTRERMDDFRQDSVRDVLDFTPGINVQKVETDRTYFTSRGFDITNFQYDGSGMPFFWGVLVGDIDTAPYEQVDILHGANGVMTGLGNPSATVNFVRKRPTYTPQAEVTLSAGSWDRRRVDIDVSGPLTESGNVRGRLIYANENKNSYLDRYSREKNVFAGLLAFDLSERDTLTVGFEQQKSDANGASWGALPLTDGSGNAIHYHSVHSNIAQPWVYWDVDTQRAFAEWEHRFDNDWVSKLTVTGVDHREDTQMFYMYAGVNSAGADTFYGLASKYKDKTRDLIGDLSFTGPFQLFGREHQLTLGANAGRSRTQERSLYDSNLYYTEVSLADALNGALPLSNFDVASPAQTSDYTNRQKSLYTAARFSLRDDLHLLAGARLLSADSDGSSYNVEQNARNHGRTTPYLGLVYDLDPQYALYASYTEIFAPQSYRDPSGKQLDPLEGKSYEVGIKRQSLDKKSSITAAVFHTKQDNVSTYAGYDASLGGSLYNGLSFEGQGLELEVAGEILPGLQLSGGYTYLWITDEDDNRARRFIPRHQLTSNLTYRLPMAPKVKVGGSLRWQSEVQYDGVDNTRQDAYALVGLMAGYEIDRHWSTQLNLDNLTNEKYLQSPRYGQSNFGEPRSVTASVSWRY